MLKWKKFLKIVHLILILLIISFEASAKSFFSDVECKLPGKKNNVGTPFTVTLGDQISSCQNICNTTLTNKGGINNTNINQDLLLNCLELCSELVSSNKDYTFIVNKKKVINGNVTQTYNNTTASFPYYNIEYNSTPLSLLLQKNQTDSGYQTLALDGATEVTISINNASDNTLYLCGEKEITLTPLFPNLYVMAPGSLSGGNASEMSWKFGQGITNPLLNKNYTSLNNFDQTKYAQSFPSAVTGLLETDLANLACNLYKTSVATGTFKGNCSAMSTKYKWNNDWCQACTAPSEEEKIKLQLITGKIQCDAKIPNSQIDPAALCNNFSLDPNQPFVFPQPEELAFYSEMTPVTGSGGTFFRSGWSNSKTGSEWDSTNSIYHPCLITQDLTGGKLDNATLTSIKSIKDQTTTDINLKTRTNSLGCYPDWHLYNDQMIDLGIEISDGDFLSIDWTGSWIIGNGITMPFIDQGLAKILAVKAEDLIPSFKQKLASTKVPLDGYKLLDYMSTVNFIGLQPLIGERGKNSQDNTTVVDYTNQGCLGNINKALSNLNQSSDNSWYGLNGSITRNMLYASDDQCNAVNFMNDNYSYNGIVKGLGQKVPLKIAPQNYDKGLATLLSNSIITGGQEVVIKWKGCPSKNGEGLEIAFGVSSTSGPTTDWFKIQANDLQKGVTFLSQDSFNNKGIKIIPSDSNLIFFRINNGGKNATGQYNLLVDKQTPFSGSEPEFLKAIPKILFETLIGNLQSIKDPQGKFDGVVVKMAIIMQEQLLGFVRVSILLFLLLNTIGFLIGTLRVNQKEILSRIIKLSIVGLLLTPDSWYWFLDTFIRIFIIGSLQLAFQIQNFLYTSINLPPNKEIFDLFSLTRFMNYVDWSDFGLKLLAVIFSSIGGIFLALMILVILFITMKMFIDSLLIYTSALVTQAILLLISPLILITKLFSITQEFFDSWAKQVIAFFLIPTVATIAVSLGSLLIFGLLEALMGFSYCSMPYDIFGNTLFKYPLLLSNLFIGSSTNLGLPMTLAISALTLLMLSTISWNIVQMAVGITTRIITFKIATMGRESMSGIASAAVSSIYNPNAISQGFSRGLKQDGLKGGLGEAAIGVIPSIAKEAGQYTQYRKGINDLQKGKKELAEFKKDFDKLSK
jgi:type IV secretory pathway VirB6-like protein